MQIFDDRRCNSNQKWNNDKCKSPKEQVCKKDYTWNPATCTCEYVKYLGCFNDDSVITYDEIIDVVLSDLN